MAEKSVTFMPETVRAILEGYKTSFRRTKFTKLFPGDVLYVRECWARAGSGFLYRADGNRKVQWKDAIYMPKDAARIWLRVKSVRTENLWDITDEGCVEAGINAPSLEYLMEGEMGSTNIVRYAMLWNRTRYRVTEDEYKKVRWEANPTVIVVDFEIMERR